jgi:hypothetical protein
MNKNPFTILAKQKGYIIRSEGEEIYLIQDSESEFRIVYPSLEEEHEITPEILETLKYTGKNSFRLKLPGHYYPAEFSIYFVTPADIFQEN